MMNKQSLMGVWDHLRQCHGIAMRVIEKIPTDKVHSHPIPDMRTPVELVVHLYASVVRGIAEGVPEGEIKSVDEASLCAGIQTRDDLLRFARESWDAASRAVGQVTDEHLRNTTKSPWGFDAPGSMFLSTISDEFFHHRGQLYAFVRQLGQEPPMMWDFEHNATEYQPKAMQQA